MKEANERNSLREKEDNEISDDEDIHDDDISSNEIFEHCKRNEDCLTLRYDLKKVVNMMIDGNMGGSLFDAGQINTVTLNMP
jgi:hypothetical protein